MFIFVFHILYCTFLQSPDKALDIDKENMPSSPSIIENTPPRLDQEYNNVQIRSRKTKPLNVSY